MSKAKTEATEAETPTVTTPEGQDAPGADAQPTTDPDGNPPSTETPGGDDAAEAAEEARLAAEEAERQERIRAEQAEAAARAAAQAEADAKHQRKVQAKAARDAKAAETAAKADDASRSGRLVLLNGLLTTVELDNTDELRDAVIASLAEAQAAHLDDDVFSLADITVVRAATLERTLADWCMEARRQIMALS